MEGQDPMTEEELNRAREEISSAFDEALALTNQTEKEIQDRRPDIELYEIGGWWVAKDVADGSTAKARSQQKALFFLEVDDPQDVEKDDLP